MNECVFDFGVLSTGTMPVDDNNIIYVNVVDAMCGCLLIESYSDLPVIENCFMLRKNQCSRIATYSIFLNF